MALSNETIRPYTWIKGYRTEYVSKRQLLRQRSNRNFFGIMKSEFLYIKEFESVEHFKIELEKYIDYYNTKRIKAKLKMSRYNTELILSSYLMK